MSFAVKNCMLLARKSAVQRFTAVPVRRESRLNDREQVIKRFRPSMDTKTAEVVTEVTERPPVNIRGEIWMKKQQEKEQQLKRRKLNRLDKYILVRIGKYKRIEDVPDEIVHRNVEAGKKTKEEAKSYLYEKGFRGVIFADYFLTLCCFALIGLTYYLYSSAKTTDDKSGPKD